MVIFKILFIILSLLYCVHCQFIEKRRNNEYGQESANYVANSREENAKRKIKDFEKNLETKQEKLQYSKLLPWFNDDDERLSYLRLKSFESKQEWIQSSGILSRNKSLSSKFKRLIDNQDIAIGMPSELVKRSWGDPVQVESSGNPIYKNEKWRYIRNISSSEGFRQEKRAVYFEGGKVVGWETE